jgi:hypothetical protein
MQPTDETDEISCLRQTEMLRFRMTQRSVGGGADMVLVRRFENVEWF